MSFFARASWPGDHRDEIVAGALTAAVIVVLGYASGIGAPAAQDLNSAAPPAAEVPAVPSARSSSGPVAPDFPPSDAGAGASDGFGTIPVADGPGGSGARGAGGHGGTGSLPGQSGGGSPSPSPSASSPGSSSPSPTPSPSPSPSQSCADGDVHLVQPLLNGVLTPVTGLLDGLLGGASPSPSASPSGDSTGVCIGVASTSALLSDTSSLLPEPTP
ncbi:hypothetical protein AB0D86_23790 [Streptomyces sp. NPDC048324]|uniref:hypothetical protein n=1 Tax=Streptomyces sp. NPDC048324 TaxID=3157205 RepID=UPI0034355644